MRTFVVLGMHRSGTSCVAGVLHHSGVYMGTSLTKPWFANPKGGYEDTEWVKVNARMIAANGGEWFNPPDQIKSPGLYEEDIRRQVRQSAREPHWGFKDPRTILTIDVIHPYLPNPHYIYVTRDLAGIIKSLATRNKWSSAKALWLTGEYLSRAGRFLQDCGAPVLYVRYEDVLDGNVKQLQEFVGSEIDLSFVDKTLCHHR